MLWKRVLSAFLLVPLIALLAIHPISFLILTCLIVALIYLEYARLTRSLGADPVEPLGLISVLSLPLLSFLDVDPLPAIVIWTVLISLAVVLRGRAEGGFISLSSTLFALLYLGWLYGYQLVQLRGMREGLELIFLLLGIVWMGDTGAYFTGKLLGRHKLIPSISPGKTIEGSIGGLVWGIGGGVAVKYIFGIETVPLGHLIAMALILGVVGQIGDLVESILKRNAGVKDSGGLIPGHGGMFDRCDSMIPVVPVMLLYLRYVLKL
ncbi:hypothetical protein DRP77_01060 [Candidatus Poribacteria bacterium]|nr:MAG: hypothetical protein DRP77_01060 [Candidatus Poribacteria bacterium]